jgi:hypothetical protein
LVSGDGVRVVDGRSEVTVMSETELIIGETIVGIAL